MRPEAWRLVSAAEGGLPINVTVVEELGADGFVYGTSDVEGTPSTVIVRVERAATRSRRATTIHVTTDPKNVHVFDTESGERHLRLTASRRSRPRTVRPGPGLRRSARQAALAARSCG